MRIGFVSMIPRARKITVVWEGLVGSNLLCLRVVSSAASTSRIGAMEWREACSLVAEHPVLRNVSSLRAVKL